MIVLEVVFDEICLYVRECVNKNTLIQVVIFRR
jgi:hypothetical protein